jgi:DNA-binding transcriptional ArsR family regulator
MTYASVLVALADPTRRGLYEQLRRRPHTVNELAQRANVTQPAVSQHLRVLTEARLVKHDREGTKRYYRASRDGLAELRRYVESLWDDVLTAYAAQDAPTATARPKKKRSR